MLNRYARAVLAMAGIACAACGDSTAPHGVTPAQLARHIDSLSVADEKPGPASNGPLVGAIPSYLEVPPGFGAAPVSVSMRTQAGAETWQGFMFRTGSSLGDEDSAYSFVAYSDYALTDVITAVVTFTKGVTVPDAQIVLGDSIAINGGTGTITETTTSVGDACMLATGLTNPISEIGSDCHLATFTGSIALTFPLHDQSPYQSVSVATQAFNGIVVK